MTQSVFAKFAPRAYPIVFEGTIVVDSIAGGIPTDSKVAEGWLKSKLHPKDDIIRQAVAEVMAERGVDSEAAAKIVDITKHLNGFKRDPERGGELYIEGRQLKACLKEAASVSVAAGKLEGRGWGKTSKGLLGFLAEHIFIVEDRLYLGVPDATGIVQRFVSTFRGTGIQYMEYVENATFNFTLMTDFEFTTEQWALIWLTAEQQGLGASRSQGFGRFRVTRWDQTSKALAS